MIRGRPTMLQSILSEGLQILPASGGVRRNSAGKTGLRLVTTSSSTKVPVNQPCRKQASNEAAASHMAQEAAGSELEEEEIYQERLRRLSLWHSLDTIKRVGYRLAELDPLGLKRPESLSEVAWNHRLVEQMRGNHNVVPTRGFLDTHEPAMTISELINTVWTIYADNDCGLEFAHMTNPEEVEWLTSEWERLSQTSLQRVEEENLAKLLLECEAFDHFMALKYPTTKRYGCEGAESMLVVFDEILRLCHSRQAGPISDIIIGMAHRGRLNLLTCLLDLDPTAIFNKTQGGVELDLSEAWMAKGDVLSHLSTNVRFVYGLDRHHIGLSRDSPEPINVSLLPNPSHLEVASPLAMGAARGRAHNLLHGYSSSPKFAASKVLQNNDEQSQPQTGAFVTDYLRNLANVLSVQVHGDGSLAGQGIVQETLQMANLPSFTVGGSLHLVINNQIGYTTDPSMGRSSRHCSDVFKLIEAPIIHVNGENILSIIRATRLALNYRQKFFKDAAINLTCFRKHGHNEMDEPAFTQPLMYDNIKRRKSIPQSFCDKVSFPDERRKQIVENFRTRLHEAHKRLDSYRPNNDDYRNFSLPTEYHRDHLMSWQTGCDLDLLKSVAFASVYTPPDFSVHPNLQRALVVERRQRFSSPDANTVKVDWATAEILAFGSLLRQNHSVRIAGQDVARGTFSTRHAVLIDQRTGEPFVPLNGQQQGELDAGSKRPRAQLEICNSILSEEASLAYEFGYSIETCELSIWEAQFGDFFNTAQSIIDTLVSSSESKWLRQSALTLLLPHGLDGAGPEHSSSHLERFLQLSSSAFDSVDTEAKVNWSVCFPTLPSQYFHLLRRQVLRPFRKPLIVMAPKVIFRHPECMSELADFGPDKTFQPVLDDPIIREGGSERYASVDTLVLCSGKVYFQLREQQLAHEMNNVAIVRVEELCPFPVGLILNTVKQYPNLKADRIVWFQEECMNQGAFRFVQERLASMARLALRYMGRPVSELPATGSGILHKRELSELMNDFRSLKSSDNIEAESAE